MLQHIPSSGAGLPDSVRFWALIVFVGVVLIGMLRFVWTFQEMNPMSIMGVSLIIGGGFSNLIDRVLKGGAVVDFMNVGVGKVRTGTFNLADLAIMTGAGILLAWGVYQIMIHIRAIGPGRSLTMNNQPRPEN